MVRGKDAMGAPAARALNELPEQPLVTVVTPSLDNVAFIRQTLATVAQQDYPAIEHIVVDGGSTDGTLQILGELPNLRWLSEPDDGQAAAINKGFRLASGDIVAWLNADDYYLPGTVARAVQAFREDPTCGMVYSGWVVVDEAGRELGRHEAQEWDLKQEIERGNFIPQPTTFVRRDALEAVGLLEERFHFAMDYDLFVRIGKRFRVQRIDGYGAAFRMHSSSKTVALKSRFYREEREISRKHGAPWLSEHMIAHAYRRLRISDAALPVTWQTVALLREGDLPGLARRARRIVTKRRP
jgi:glycosyltransferase involved in cell wall biosynthesis